MADPIAIYSDLETFLIGWYRTHLQLVDDPVVAGVEFDRVEPSGDASAWPDRLVIIRDDGTADDGRPFVGDASVGISVLAGTRENPFIAKRLAAIIFGLLPQIPSTGSGNPVAALLSRRGPFMVNETQPRARLYMTAELAVVPEAL